MFLSTAVLHDPLVPGNLWEVWKDTTTFTISWRQEDTTGISGWRVYYAERNGNWSHVNVTLDDDSVKAIDANTTVWLAEEGAGKVFDVKVVSLTGEVESVSSSVLIVTLRKFLSLNYRFPHKINLCSFRQCSAMKSST